MTKNLSTFAIAKMLHVDPGSVANWIDQDLLKAHRTPGGHRRVMREDLIDFLHRHKMPIPSEMVDGPIRILIVDDEAGVAGMIAKNIQLTHPDYEVIEAHDGFRAGTIVATMHPDVVLLDLRMPGMDGYEVCQEIRNQEGSRQTEIIAMTAYPSPESKARIQQCGARTCLSKPLDTALLLRELDAAIQNRRAAAIS